MKKEFKAPVVEAKELNALNSIMDGGMLISTNGINGKSLVEVDAENVTDYKQWRKNR